MISADSPELRNFTHAVLFLLAFNYAIGKMHFHKLKCFRDTVMAEFVSCLVGMWIVWTGMGLVAFIPGLNQLVGWNWIPEFVSHMTSSDWLGNACGLLISLAILSLVTLHGYKFCTRHVWSHVQTTRRWILIVTSFYLSTVCLDLTRISFTPNNWRGFLISLGSRAAVNCAIMATGLVVDRHFQRRWRFNGTQLAALMVTSSLFTNLLRKGTVHGDDLQYATFYRQMVASPPGIILAVSLTGLVVMSILALRRVSDVDRYALASDVSRRPANGAPLLPTRSPNSCVDCGRALLHGRCTACAQRKTLASGGALQATYLPKYGPRLIVRSSVRTGQTVSLSALPLLIGRSPQSQIALTNDKKVSRLHAEVSATGPNEYYIKDRQSRNGTFVNGRRIQKHLLQHGDEMRIGDTEIVFRR